MSVAGSFETTAKSPMGEQKGILTIVPDASGSTFTGTMVNGMGGSMDAENGTISGNTLRWTAKMTAPMPMTLECEATVDGDAISGTIKAGMFGSMPMTGQRTA